MCVQDHRVAGVNQTWGLILGGGVESSGTTVMGITHDTICSGWLPDSVQEVMSETIPNRRLASWQQQLFSQHESLSLPDMPSTVPMGIAMF